MNIQITIILAIAGIIALFLIIAPFLKKNYVNFEVIINALRQKVINF